MPEIRIQADVGIQISKDISNILPSHENISPIIATETIDFIGDLYEVTCLLSDGFMASIDIRGGKILSRSKEISSFSISTYAKLMVDFGAKSIIGLDMDRVGSENGPNLAMAKAIREAVDIEVIVAGGIRNEQDLKALDDLGINCAFVASALHNGNLPAKPQF